MSNFSKAMPMSRQITTDSATDLQIDEKSSIKGNVYGQMGCEILTSNFMCIICRCYSILFRGYLRNVYFK